MRFCLGRLLPAVLLIVSGCSTAPAPLPTAARFDRPAEPQGIGIGTPSRSPSGDGVQLEEWSVEAFFVPFMVVEADSDEPDVGPTVADPDVDPGTGFGARVGIGDEDQGIGVMYVGTFHDEENTARNAETHSVYADFHARGRFWAQSSTQAWLKFNGGFGLASLSYDGAYDDEISGALQLRGVVQLEFSQRASIDIGLAGFLWGLPGDTLAYGSYMTVGGTVRF